jgi:hypothetical protein
MVQTAEQGFPHMAEVGQAMVEVATRAVVALEYLGEAVDRTNQLLGLGRESGEAPMEPMPTRRPSASPRSKGWTEADLAVLRDAAANRLPMKRLFPLLQGAHTERSIKTQMATLVPGYIWPADDAPAFAGEQTQERPRAPREQMRSAPRPAGSPGSGGWSDEDLAALRRAARERLPLKKVLELLGGNHTAMAIKIRMSKLVPNYVWPADDGSSSDEHATEETTDWDWPVVADAPAKPPPPAVERPPPPVERSRRRTPQAQPAPPAPPAPSPRNGDSDSEDSDADVDSSSGDAQTDDASESDPPEVWLRRAKGAGARPPPSAEVRRGTRWTPEQKQRLAQAMAQGVPAARLTGEFRGRSRKAIELEMTRLKKQQQKSDAAS